MSADEPFCIFAREFCDSPEERHEVKNKSRKSKTLPKKMPKEIHQSGLDIARQEYLFSRIREFCAVATQDTTCPKPSNESAGEVEDAAPKSKKRRK